MKIFVTGACGYKGTVLVPKLLDQGHDVVAYDTQWFGNHLVPARGLKLIKGDVRDIDNISLEGIDAVIHLASIANDPCGDLNPKLTWEVSCLSTMRLAEKSKRSGVKQFVYASSGSVYGVKEESQVTEDLDLVPISEYNKTKMVAERVLLSYSDEMVVQIVRPATVCGLSPRMRLDVSVNMLTMQALQARRITLHGGAQVRPNIHIDDITDLYVYFINNPDKKGVFNAGFENISLLEMANMIASHITCDIEITQTIDQRSYRLNSDKLLATGFKPKKNVSHAIFEIRDAYQEGRLIQNPSFYNLKWMESNDYA
jgi:nucleoside-diphosphate-sugar epimerase